MFSEKDLSELLDYSSQSGVLSVYLNTNPVEVQADTAKIQLRNLLKTIDLVEDVQAVERYVDLEYDWSSKGVIVFSDQRGGFFKAYQLDISVPDRAFLGQQPVIRPLVQLMETYTGWGVVLVDKQSARLFSFNLGALVESESILGDEVKQTKRGGGDTMFGRGSSLDASGKVESIIERNTKTIVEYAASFFKQHHIRRILIGGSEENIVRFKEALPKAWQSLIVGNFPISMTAGHPEIQGQTSQAVLESQRKINRRLINQAVTLTAKGVNGVTGLIDTLNAIHEGRVKILLVSPDFEQAGFRCEGCGYLAVQDVKTCPFCNGNFKRIDDAVEMAVRETLRNNAEVKVIGDDPALTQAGQIVAILRY
ncbi:MAG: hypothetical protein GX142_05050 [Chloroflexi bacterium]|nr:hypothetical protein [Chloroflexota bacterium]